jgi:hypothetical protein
VLRDIARRKADEIFDPVDDAEVDDGKLVEHRRYIAQEKKIMIAALQAARIPYQAMMIMATTAKGERQPGQVGAGRDLGSAGVN